MIHLEDCPVLRVTFDPWDNTPQSVWMSNVEQGPSSSHSQRIAVISRPGIKPPERKFPLFLVGNPTAAAAVPEEPLPDTRVTEAGADVEVPLLVEVPSPPSDRKPFEVPGTITEQMTQAVKDQVLSQLPEGVQFDDFYPEAVISYASGKRPQDCV
jgi:hypothetical protein